MYKTVLVPVDLDEPSSFETILPRAAELCKTLGADMALATIVPDLRLVLEVQQAPITLDEMLETARTRLDALADTIVGLGPVARHVTSGSIYHQILKIADQVGADLVVMAAHRPTMSDFLLGSNSARVVRHARCSVLIMRP